MNKMIKKSKEINILIKVVRSFCGGGNRTVEFLKASLSNINIMGITNATHIYKCKFSSSHV